MVTLKINEADHVVVSEKIDLKVINQIVDEIQKDPKFRDVQREKIVATVKHIAVYLLECGVEMTIPLSTPTIRVFKNLYETWFGK